MKKIIMALVCLMAAVAFTSCGDVNKDMEDACGKYFKFATQLTTKHAENDADYMWEIAMLKVKNPKIESKADSIIKAFYSDADLILAKCFDPIFEKYGEKSTLDAFVKLYNENSYNNIAITSKEEFYNGLRSKLYDNYEELRNSKLELNKCEYELNELKKRLH